ncbi:MAG: hypothetical protein HOE80_04760 [Candidatus Magasanikbacteria bacterium]|nr:hypothetical protein [Candidatus Magasanikbacteria bacterium]MBT4072001.1 hypothetical protein [Candidatus Magasanikbacteria bacterium]
MSENKKDDIAYGRMSFHMPFGFIAVLLVQILAIPQKWIELLLHVIVVIYISIIEILRLIGQHYWKNKNDCNHPLHLWCYLHHKCLNFSLKKKILRDTEISTISSSLWYVFGIYITYFLFPVWIAVPALLYLAIGDPMARAFGIGLKGKKRKWLMNKTIEGAFGFFISGGFAVLITVILNGWFSLYPTDIALSQLLVMLVVGDTVGMLSEIYSGKVDNLSIPVFSGLAMHLYYGYVILGV